MGAGRAARHHVNRGSVVIVRMGDTPAAKARPCVIVSRQSAVERGDKVTVCPLTSVLKGAGGWRPFLPPDSGNGLRRPSEVQVDWVFTVHVDRIGALVGQVDEAAVDGIDMMLRHWLAL